MSFIMLATLFGIIGVGILFYGMSSVMAQSRKEDQESSIKNDEGATLVNQLTNKVSDMERMYADLLQKYQKVSADMVNEQAKVSQMEAAAAAAVAASEREVKAIQAAELLKNEIVILKEKISNKEQGLERASTLNAELAKELKVSEEKGIALERQNKEMAEEDKVLRASLVELKAKAVVQAEDPEKIKELTIEAQKLQKAVVQKHAECDALRKELVVAKNEVEACRKEVRPALPQGVPEEEYLKIKDKLEAAEKVLRIIHGAG